MVEGVDPSVQVAAITALGTAVVAIIGGIITIVTLLVQTKGHAKRADTQVSNNHVDEHGEPINLREEADQRHAELLGVVDNLAGDIRGMRRDVGRIDTRTHALRTDLTDLRQKVDRVEDTQQQDTIRELRSQLRERNGTHDPTEDHPS